MSYVDQSSRPSAASMAAVVGVHAAFAAILVAGLTVSGTMPEIINKIGATNIPIDPPPPPKPVDPVEPKAAEPTETLVHIPTPKLDLKPADPPFENTPLVFPPLPKPSPGLGTEIPKPTPQPGLDPVAAKPRNNPGAWLTDNDYRPSWIRQELTGLAKFRLEIAADGRVTNCTVTGSTGHGELDDATCKLVTRRARFEPARDSNGQAVAGSFNSSVLWQLPE
ncbi:energy transducer TonB [Qipengyuania qiaonensis]|uniref:Energy transducer TonB n=1 Tax=Qipengyuania qiaonensis TaxID=2867240 RepID=A0ABS7JCC5_9SPHN|nr:energy transducer TonB [Qipengyuania qiaonensis]MBX7483709.1 energy transducer TonB [Qipengyuania qiaonensis]